MYLRTLSFIVDEFGAIERRAGDVPAIIGVPALKVSVAANADMRDTVRRLRALADEIESQSSTAGGAGNHEGD